MIKTFMIVILTCIIFQNVSSKIPVSILRLVSRILNFVLDVKTGIVTFITAILEPPILQFLKLIPRL